MRKARLIIWLYVICIILASCSSNNIYLSEEIEEVKVSQVDKKSTEDNDEENQEENQEENLIEETEKNIETNVVFSVEEGKLYFEYENMTTLVSDLQYDELRDVPNYVTISYESKDYIVLYYGYPTVGFKGYDYYVYLYQYNKENPELKQVWNSEQLSIEKDFKDSNIISTKINILDETFNDEFNLNELLESKGESVGESIRTGETRISSVSSIGIKDYDRDNEQELFIRYDIFNTQRNIYLMSMYVIIELSDVIDTEKVFLSNQYNTLDMLIEYGYLDKDNKTSQDLEKHLRVYNDKWILKVR